MKRVRIETASPSATELLGPQALGPGGLIVIQSSPTGSGTGYVEIGTVPLVAGQDEYAFIDIAGIDSTWYRTTYDSAARDVLPDYSAEFQPAPDSASYLTVSEFREHVSTTLPDTAVQRLLAANTLAIEQRAGPLGAQPLTLLPRRDVRLYLDRPIASIVSVREVYGDPVGISGITLATNDYKVLNGGRVLERWGYGTNPADWWSERVELVYVPVDDTQERIRVLVKLCELDLNRQPGLSEVRIGDYMEQSRNEPYNDEREAILASLVPSGASFA